MNYTVASRIDSSVEFLKLKIGGEEFEFTVTVSASKPHYNALIRKDNFLDKFDLIDHVENNIGNQNCNFSIVMTSGSMVVMIRSYNSNDAIFYQEKEGELYVSLSYIDLCSFSKSSVSDLKLAELCFGMNTIPFEEVSCIGRGIKKVFDSDGVFECQSVPESKIMTNYGQCIRDIRDSAFSTVESYFPPGARILVFLSGGFDSSLLACLMSKFTYHISLVHWYFPELNIANELGYAKSVAEAINAELISVPISVSDYINTWLEDDLPLKAPFNHVSYPWWKLAFQKVRHLDFDYIVSGKGAERMYECSEKVFDVVSIKSISIFCELLTTRMPISDILGNGESGSNNNFHSKRLFSDKYRSLLNGFRISELDMVDNQEISFKYIFDGNLRNGIYSPLMAPEFQSLCASIPSIYKVGAKSGVVINKRIFREAFKDVVPTHVLCRSSQPFMDAICRNALINYKHKISKYMSDSRLVTNGIIDIDVFNNPEDLMSVTNSVFSSIGVSRWLHGK